MCEYARCTPLKETSTPPDRLAAQLLHSCPPSLRPPPPCAECVGIVLHCTGTGGQVNRMDGSAARAFAAGESVALITAGKAPVLSCPQLCAALGVSSAGRCASGSQPIGLRVGAGRGLADLHLCRAPLVKLCAQLQLHAARRSCDGLCVCGSATARLAKFASAAFAPTVAFASLQVCA